MIKPTPADIGRLVALPRFGDTPITGKLVEVFMADLLNADPLAAVMYPDMKMPVMTDTSKLEWADESR